MRRRPLPIDGFRVACLAALMSLAPVCADAFEGRVVDRRTGQPIAGAEVGIAGLAGTVRTRPDGTFTWAPDPALPFEMLVILPDGRLATSTPVVSFSTTGPIDVAIDPTFVQTITVSGSSPTIEASPAGAATLVTSMDIERRAPANLMLALEGVTGVSGVAEGQTAVPAIRGLARGRTLLLLDGSRLFSERRAGPSVSFLAPESLDRIEVVRGPASVAYGSDAFGGVVSMITRRPAAGARLDARFAATYGAGVPAVRHEAQVAAGLGTRGGVVVEARNRHARDYSSPAGEVPNSAWRDRGALARIGIMAGGWLTAGVQMDDVSDSGLPRSDSATLRVSIPYERSRRASFSFDRSGVRAIGDVTVTGMWGRYEQRLDQDRVSAPGRPRRIDRADIDGSDVELRAIGRRGLGGARLAIGADIARRYGLHAHDVGIAFNAAGVVSSTTDNVSIASAERRNVGAFAQIEMPVRSRVTAAAGARFDRVHSVNEGGFFGDRSISHGAASGSASMAVRAWSSLTLTAQVSSGFRDPTLSDRFFRGPVGRGFIVGNPDLGPERSRQFDVAVRFDRTSWRVVARSFHYDIDDLIERYQSGADLFLFRNRGTAAVNGIEIEAGVTTAHGLTLDVSGQATRGRTTDTGVSLDDLPPARLMLQARQSIGPRVFVAGRVSAFSRDASPGPTEVATPGYVDAGATASWKFSRRIELRVAAANLLNQRYYSSPSSRGVLAPGRFATVTVVIKK